MALSTVDRIETAPVPAVFGAGVAVETVHAGVGAILEVSRIGVMAFAARVGILSACRLQPGQQAGDEDADELAQLHGAGCS
jgi:hypothetical protein